MQSYVLYFAGVVLAYSSIFSDHSPPKKLHQCGEPLTVGLIDHPLEPLNSCRVLSPALQNHDLFSSPSNTISLIKWTNMMFCRMSRCFNSFRICNDSGQES